MKKADDSSTKLVLITGPSGAGKSTAINTLEDLGYEAIDNLPLSLLPKLLEGDPPRHLMALGIDARNRDFSTKFLVEVIDRLAADTTLDLTVCYLECRTDVCYGDFRKPAGDTRWRQQMVRKRAYKKNWIYWLQFDRWPTHWWIRRI